MIFWNFKEITLPLRQPSVWLIQICDVPRIDKSISKIPTEDIKITKINEEASIVSWSDRSLKTKCIEYYKVDFFDGEESERFSIKFLIIIVIIFQNKYIFILPHDIFNSCYFDSEFNCHIARIMPSLLSNLRLKKFWRVKMNFNLDK